MQPDASMVQAMLMRRASQAPLPVPSAASQLTQPSGGLPTGGPNVPRPMPMGGMPTPTAPSPVNLAPGQGQVGVPGTAPGQPAGAPNPAMRQTQGMVKGVGQAMGPNFDDETRQVAKMLIGKLVQHI